MAKVMVREYHFTLRSREKVVGRGSYWLLHWPERGGEPQMWQEFPYREDAGREEYLTQVCSFLRGRGEHIIGVSREHDITFIITEATAQEVDRSRLTGP